MKFKILNGILIVDILSILLALSIIFIPSTAVRVILGLPFILFFPGYVLTTAIFVKNEGMPIFQRVAISAGMSIVVVGLLGFGLNFTIWGIRLEPVLFALTGFIFLMSAVTLIRRTRTLKTNKLIMECNINVPGWSGSAFNKSLSIFLVVAIISALVVLGYAIAAPKTGERFTEFYILGINGQAQDYPVNYVINNKQITQVTYGDGTIDVTSGMGKVTLGIVNQEEKAASYSVKMTIDSEPVNIDNGGITTDILGPVDLQQGEKWESEIGIVPQHAGDNQKVELLLFKDNGTTPEDSLHFWVNVNQVG